MPSLPSRELRNHTARVLRQVAEGDTVTITVNGEPVAEISRPSEARRPFLTRAEVCQLHDGQAVDAALVEDLRWISGGSTDDLGPVR